MQTVEADQEGMNGKAMVDLTKLTIVGVLNDTTSSTWLKASLMAAAVMDPVDVANDAEVLAGLLVRRCDEWLANGGKQ